jgi:transcriptional regulator with XRE-family HTH domain
MPVSRSEHVAAEVRAEVARQRISQQVLAEKLAMSEGQVSFRLNGHVEFKVSELLAIAEVLGVPVTRFLPEPAPAAAGTTSTQ